MDLVFIFGHMVWHVGFKFPNQGIEPSLLALEGRFLTTGPPGKFHGFGYFQFSALIILMVFREEHPADTVRAVP